MLFAGNTFYSINGVQGFGFGKLYTGTFGGTQAYLELAAIYFWQYIAPNTFIKPAANTVSSR
jgi:hypothetical protein